MGKSSSAAPVIGIDVGGTNITAGLIDENNQVIAREKTDTEADKGLEHVVSRIAAMVQALLSDNKSKGKQVVGIGLGIPGAVDVEAGTVIEAVNLRWNDVNIVKLVQNELKLPVTLDNDVNVGTWGSYVGGAGKGASALMGIFVGTGIGAGLVLNGQLYQGPFGTAGEIGHTIMDPGGPVGLQTLEQLASRTAIVTRIHSMAAANAENKIMAIAASKGGNIRSKVLSKALDAGCPLTTRVVKDAAQLVAVAIANTVTLLSLDCVVVGGGLTEACGETWMKWIRKRFDRHVFPDTCKQCRLVASTLGDDAGLIGAGLLARQRFSK